MQPAADDLDMAFPPPADRGAPKLSVVVMALNTGATLARCLGALTKHAQREDVEILVVGHDRERPENGSSALQERFPEVVWLATPAHYTVPQRRSAGIARSHGPIVALLEDDCVVNDRWCASIIAAHRASPIAIGGPIEPGNYRTGLDWAVFFCEYSRFMPPFAGAVPALPGNNVAYKRSALAGVMGDQGFYEVFVHRLWQQRGHTLVADPSLVVYNTNARSCANTLRSAYHHGRAFASMRVEDGHPLRRSTYVAGALFLPPLQVARVVRNVLSRRRHVRALFRALPWVALFAASWSWGEFLGYLRGPGGSVNQWR